MKPPFLFPSNLARHGESKSLSYERRFSCKTNYAYEGTGETIMTITYLCIN